MENSKTINTSTIDGIDLDKLQSVVRKNKWWILFFFILCNTVAYLSIRWTKDLFESESEMKLEIKSDATDLGIKKIVEDQNLNLISGEIEQIKSKVFLSRLIDSLDIETSYYSIGNVLTDEMYQRSPFLVQAVGDLAPRLFDQNVYINIIDNATFKIKIDPDSEFLIRKFNDPFSLNGATIIVQPSDYFEVSDNKYFFVIHSKGALITYLAQNISVSPLNFNANTIRVAFKDHNAKKAFDIVNKIDSLYIFYSSEQKNLANRQKIGWLNNELGQVEKRMQDYENYFENFTLQNKSSDLSQDLKRTIIAINATDSARFQLTKKITQLNSVIEQINDNKLPFSLQQQRFLPEYINKKLEDFNRLQQDRDRLALAYNENTFAFRQKEKEVSLAKETIFKQLTELKSDWLKTLAELRQSKENLEKGFATMPDKNTQYSKNQRFYKLYEEFYLSMMQSKAQFEIAQAGNVPDFKILSPASLPTVPISPKKLLILGIGLVASLVINFFFLGISYLLNNKITSAQEVEKSIHVPLLGVIPSTTRKSNSLFQVVDNPKSMVSESFRSLRTNLDFFTIGGRKKIITVTSTISGEGKSFLATNLGGVLSMSKKKVLLIDLDMRKQKNESSMLALDPSKGVSTTLIKKTTWAECIQSTDLENLDFLPAGPHPPNPSELLLNGEFTNLLDELKEAYDFIVIDTPPVGLVTDGIMAMKRADLSIYVIRANYSKKDFLNTLSRLLNIHKLTNLAVVLNALPTTGKTHGYGYYEDTPKRKGWRDLVKV
ncbi:MAG: polysaccharide biosynthesis tyrosine autokinase [Cytophagales bacterium]|nr:polysaccharide biosynthesis tyrosine autokinase [Cytophagales bacterium]MCA6389067.1 polysaccharide biosynthesis tyrosine autokinase [Cytophagales bacterium]MCA6390771.1 polysaccharide biosynthesis tyrosine autokinase [Cytophagales bacterium]MCA6399582.1 polysaccharide biosynthesis tyrosine autokinase [Cytophagales bacterium]MCA6402308.1 polysaccharide biosynthesis tyrosine autokinase [Cytophagales bacterium]